jgi:ferredoxin
MLWIDKNKCIGCGICMNICPEGIEIINGKAKIKDENADCLRDAASACPREAIVVEGANEKTEPNVGFNQGYGQGMGEGMGQGRGIGAGRGGGLGRGSRDDRGRGRGGSGEGRGRGRW